MATGRIPSQFAYDGDKTSLPLTDSRGYLNWKDGYTADYERRIGTDLNAKAVERSKYNYILALITENLKQWQDQAFPDWRGVSVGTEDQTYAINSTVKYTVNGVLYRAIQAVPSGVLPTNTVYWEVVPTSSWITSMSPMPSGGGDPSKEIISVTGTDLNNYTSGTWEFSSTAAAGTSNTPTNTASLLISKAWSVSGTNYRSQQWLSTDGTEWHRSLMGSSWTPWTQVTHRSDVSGTGLFGATKVANLNDAVNTGFYQFSSSAANIPWSGNDGGLIYVCATGGSTNRGIQLAIQATSTASDLTPWVRHFKDSIYTAWQRTPLMASIPMPYGGDAGTGLITVATDFNTIPNGTFEMTAAAAAGSQNSPMSNRCLIECKVWADVNTRSMQRVTDITANRIYSRSFDGTSWSVWVSDYNPNYKPTPADIGAVPYATFSDWGTTTAKNAVVGMLTWQQYGSGYVVFDASKKVAPNGAVVSNTDAYAPWVPQNPILVGWNGANTCGVRVDSARVADSAGTAASSGVTSSWELENTSTNADGQTLWPVTISTTTNAGWYRLCTLPKSSTSTFDSLTLMVSAGSRGTIKVNFVVNMGNCNGFHWSGYCDSDALNFMAAWQQPDGSTIVGMYLQSWSTADIVMKWSQGTGIIPEVSAWNPTGTKVWASDINKIPRMWHSSNLPITVGGGNAITTPSSLTVNGPLTVSMSGEGGQIDLIDPSSGKRGQIDMVSGSNSMRIFHDMSGVMRVWNFNGNGDFGAPGSLFAGGQVYAYNQYPCYHAANKPTPGDIGAQAQSTNLSALASVTGSANWFPYFTSQTSMAITPLTSFARSLLSADSAQTARSVLSANGNIWGSYENASGTSAASISVSALNASVINIYLKDGSSHAHGQLSYRYINLFTSGQLYIDYGDGADWVVNWSYNPGASTLTITNAGRGLITAIYQVS